MPPITIPPPALAPPELRVLHGFTGALCCGENASHDVVTYGAQRLRPINLQLYDIASIVPRDLVQVSLARFPASHHHIRMHGNCAVGECMYMPPTRQKKHAKFNP